MTKNSRFLPSLAQRVAGGMSVRAAADEIKCSERHAYTIAATAEFRDIVSRLRTESVTQAAAILASAATKAATVLSELLESDDEKIKLAAAVKVLSTMQSAAEFAELRKRLDDLERSSFKVAR